MSHISLNIITGNRCSENHDWKRLERGMTKEFYPPCNRDQLLC